MSEYNPLCSDISSDVLSRLKSAISAFRWNDEAIPREFHLYLFVEKWCKEKILLKYLSKHDLNPEAECLLFDRYYETNPDIVVNYITQWYPSTEFQLKILKCEKSRFINALFDKLINSRLSEETEIEIVKTMDIKLLSLFFSKAGKFSSNKALQTAIEQMSPEVLKIVSAYHHSVSLKPEQELRFLNSGDEFLYNLVLKWGGKKISDKAFLMLIENENSVVLDKYLSNQLCIKQDVLLVKSKNKKLLEKYVNLYPLSKEAQIELVKLDDRDMLRFHYDKHGISRETTAYYAHLRMFKDYIGVV